MNLVDQWFPKRVNDEDILIDNMCMVMHFYGMPKQELDNLSIPEYIIMRDYAIKKLKEEASSISKMLGGVRRG